MFHRNRGIAILAGILLLGVALLIFSHLMEDSSSMFIDDRESRYEENPTTRFQLDADINANSLSSIHTMNHPQMNLWVSSSETQESASPSSPPPNGGGSRRGFLRIDMDELFKMDPKEEPEKGLILIGLGIAIIFIVLAVMRYYKKKAEGEDEKTDETKRKREKKESREIKTRKIGTEEDKGHLSGRPPSMDGRKFRKKKHPDKAIAKVQEKLLTGGSHARKNAIKVLGRAVAEDPVIFAYIIDGLAQCLEDKDKGVLKAAMELIEEGMKHFPDDLGELARNLVELLDHGSEDISRKAEHVLAEMAGGSAMVGSKIISVIKEGYKVELTEGEVDETELDRMIGYNGLLVEVGKKRPELISDITNVLARCFTYPIYRPETSETGMEELYKSGGASIAALSKISPSGTAHSLPKIMKVVADTNMFKDWKEEKDGPEGMKRTFEQVFETVSSSDPEATMAHILKSGSASNKVMAKTARSRIGKMAREDLEKATISLLRCLGNREEKIRKNAVSILDDITMINPALSINLILGYMTVKNDQVLSSCASLLANLLDKTGAVSIGNISPILALADNPSREVRQSVLALLGKIGERDSSKAPRCIDRIIKGLKQEWGVRLTALSSLETLSRADPNLRNFSIPYFIESLGDKHDQVRWRASNILRELGVEESDIKHFESAQKLMDFVLPKLKELHRRTSLDLSDIKTEMAKAKEMMKLGRYGPAEIHAGRVKEMFLQLQVSARPELDIKLLPGTTFVVGEHTAFKLAVTNTGMVHIDNIDLGFSEDVEIIEGIPLSLNAGVTEDIKLALTPAGAGRRPLKVKMKFRERGGTEIQREKNVWLDIGAEREEAGDDEGGGVSELVWE